MSEETGVEVRELAVGGPGLAFIGKLDSNEVRQIDHL